MPNIVIQINDFQVTETQTLDGNTVYTPINSSAQVGDLVYYAADTGNSIMSDATQIGEITEFTSSGYIKVNANADVISILPNNPFILFSKRIQINESSVKGYYADVTLENHSNKRAELFALSSEIVPSSK